MLLSRAYTVHHASFYNEKLLDYTFKHLQSLTSNANAFETRWCIPIYILNAFLTYSNRTKSTISVSDACLRNPPDPPNRQMCLYIRAQN